MDGNCLLKSRVQSTESIMATHRIIYPTRKPFDRPFTVLVKINEIDKLKKKNRKIDLVGHLMEDKCGSECTLCSS